MRVSGDAAAGFAKAMADAAAIAANSCGRADDMARDISNGHAGGGISLSRARVPTVAAVQPPAGRARQESVRCVL
jgi:hypothetical protein